MELQSQTNFYSKNGRWLVMLLWLASTIVYISVFGLTTTKLEAGKYLEEAVRFVNQGSFSAPRYWFYSVTLFIMIIGLVTKIGMTGAFVLQALLNLFAYLLFYRALKKLFPNPVTPVLIIAYLLFFWPYQYWIVFLYTESAFFSLLLILFSVMVLYPPDRPKHLLLLLLALLLVILSRPLGILFAAGVYGYLFYHAGKKWKLVMAGVAVLLLGFGYYAVNLIFSTLRDWSITQAFEQQSIICDLPGDGPYPQLDLATSGSPVYHLWYYLTHNFSHFLHFAGVKLRYFFLMARPYYSNGHNYFLLINTILLYTLAAISLFIRQRKFGRDINAFLFISIFLYTLTIIFQCDDYHNRFIGSIYPFFVILAARTLGSFSGLLFKHRQ